MEMKHQVDGNAEVADGDEGGSGGLPLPTPAQLDAEIQSAQAAAAQMEEEEQEAHAGRSHCSLLQTVSWSLPIERNVLISSTVPQSHQQASSAQLVRDLV